MKPWSLLLLLGGCDIVLGLDKNAELLDAAPDASFDPARCPPGYEVAVAQPTRYRAIDMDLSWDEQHALCRADDPARTHLAVLDGPFELEDVHVWLEGKPFGNVYLWVGARQASTASATDEGWTWLSKAPIAASAWDVGEPNDDDGTEADGREQTASIRRGSTIGLTDINQTLMNRAICECDGIAETQ